jgi:hypothetical protein
MIVDRPAVVLTAKTYAGWLPPVRYFLHGLAIMAVASSLLTFGIDRWISNLYHTTIDAFYEAANQEDKRLESTNGAEREATYKKRDEYRAWALKLEQIKNAAGNFLGTYGTVRSLLLPVALVLASYIFKLLFRTRSFNQDRRSQAHVLHLYLMFSFCFWPIFLVNFGELIWLYKRAYFEMGIA